MAGSPTFLKLKGQNLVYAVVLCSSFGFLLCMSQNSWHDLVAFTDMIPPQLAMIWACEYLDSDISRDGETSVNTLVAWEV